MESTVEGPSSELRQCSFCAESVPAEVMMLCRHVLRCRHASSEAREVARTTLARQQGLVALGDPQALVHELYLAAAEIAADGIDPMELMGGSN